MTDAIGSLAVASCNFSMARAADSGSVMSQPINPSRPSQFAGRSRPITRCLCARTLLSLLPMLPAAPVTTTTGLFPVMLLSSPCCVFYQLLTKRYDPAKDFNYASAKGAALSSLIRSITHHRREKLGEEKYGSAEVDRGLRRHNSARLDQFNWKMPVIRRELFLRQA